MRKIGLLGLLVSFAIGSAAVAADPPNPQAQPAGVQERVNPGMQAQTGKFVDRGGRVFNVQAYGAVVDGRKDVTASFAAAFADAEATGGCVFIPPAPHVGGVGYVVNSPRSGTVSTNGTTVTRVSGAPFVGGSAWLDLPIVINGVTYQIASVTNSNTLILTGSAATQSGVNWSMGVFSFKRPICIEGGTGGGLYGTTLITNYCANCDLFDFAQGSQGSRIQGLSLRSGGNPTQGAGIVVDFNASKDADALCQITISDMSISHFWDGIVAPRGNRNNGVYMTRINSVANLHSGMTIHGGLAYYLNQSQFLGDGLYDIDLEGGAAYWFTDVQAYHGTTGLMINRTAQVFMENLVVDTTSSDAIVVQGGSHEIGCTNCWAGGATGKTPNRGGWSVDLQSTRGFNWIGGFIRSSWLGGVHIQSGASKVSIANARISDNGHNNTSSICNGVRGACGVLVDEGASYFQILNNQIGVDDGDTAGEQLVGVAVASGASDHYQILGNLNTDPAHVSTNFIVDRGSGAHKSVANNN